VVLLTAAPGLAHIDAAGVGEGGFLSGLRHPLTGLDHVVAMVAVGLWGAQLGAPAVWMLPVAFPLVMAFGGVLGIVGVGLPGVNLGIAASALVLGAMVALEVKPPLWLALAMIGVFAVFHGYAHGSVLPAFGVPVLFASGFVASTGFLHLCGIILGLAVSRPMGGRMVRGLGLVVGAVGAYFLISSLSHL